MYKAVNLVNPLYAFIVSIILLIALLYKKVGLGVSLTAAAFLMSLLSLGATETVSVLVDTLMDPVTLTLVSASLLIMLLSILYKETGLINDLTGSLSSIIKNSKIVVSLLPAIIGLMPVAGGALMSAPMVEAEAEKLGLDNSKKTYVNIWFRHAILPLYPVSQFLVLTAALTQTSMGTLISRQFIPVLVMLVAGYLIGLRKTRSIPKTDNRDDESNRRDNLKLLSTSFTPIIVTIVLAAGLNVNISVATLAGVVTILLITRTRPRKVPKLLKDKSMWAVTLAAFGALLLRNVTLASGASQILGAALTNPSLNQTVLLALVPAALGFLLGSPSGAVALSVPILAETMSLSPASAGLLYISAYLGYLGAPTHLCLVFTAHYFKSAMSKSYKYLVPSVAVSMAAALLTYLFL